MPLLTLVCWTAVANPLGRNLKHGYFSIDYFIQIRPLPPTDQPSQKPLYRRLRLFEKSLKKKAKKKKVKSITPRKIKSIWKHREQRHLVQSLVHLSPLFIASPWQRHAVRWPWCSFGRTHSWLTTVRFVCVASQCFWHSPTESTYFNKQHPDRT